MLDFINEGDFLYFKYHGDNLKDISTYEDEPTMMQLLGPKPILDDQVEGMIIETSFEKLWDLDESYDRSDAKFIARQYKIACTNLFDAGDFCGPI